MAEINIQHEETETKGAFFVTQEGKRLAEMTYSKAGTERIIIDHTEVDDALRGQSVGKKLVFAAVEMARAKGIKILPLCPFARATFSRNREWYDVT